MGRAAAPRGSSARGDPAYAASSRTGATPGSAGALQGCARGRPRLSLSSSLPLPFHLTLFLQMYPNACVRFAWLPSCCTPIAFSVVSTCTHARCSLSDCRAFPRSVVITGSVFAMDRLVGPIYGCDRSGLVSQVLAVVPAAAAPLAVAKATVVAAKAMVSTKARPPLPPSVAREVQAPVASPRTPPKASSSGPDVRLLFCIMGVRRFFCMVIEAHRHVTIAFYVVRPRLPPTGFSIYERLVLCSMRIRL
jgi:hypothetical protein